MKKASVLLPFLFAVVACSVTHHAVTIGEITLPEKPRAGKHTKILYRIDSLAFANKNNVQLTLYYTVKNKIYALPVNYSFKGKKIKTSVFLPDTAQAFALKAQTDYVISNEKNGYISPIYNTAGKPVAGALSGVSLFYNDIGMDHIGSSLLSRPVNEEAALKLMLEDFTAHSEIRHTWMGTYLNTLLDVKKEAAYTDIDTALQQMLQSDGVRTGDYATAYNLFLRMDLWNKADAVMKAGAKKFSDGPMAKKIAADRFYSFRESTDSMLVQYQKFKQAFPYSDSLDMSQTIQYSMLATMAGRYSDSGHDKRFLFYLSSIKNPVQKAHSYYYWSQTFIQQNIALSLADSLAKISLDLLTQAMNNPEALKRSYQTNKDWERVMQHLYARYADDYASFLNKKGRLKEAVAYQATAIKYQDGERPDMNERYVQYLIENKDYKTAQVQSKRFITNGNATDKIEQDLKFLYVHFNGSAEGYADYHHNLEEKAKAGIRSYLASAMMNEPAPDFALTDLKGHSVSLSALKGKVIVLDFWATWCGPCKASFPGMQQVVDHFKEDSNVVFLFVNTFEDAQAKKRIQEVSDFITDHHYRFRVLLDRQKTEDTTKYQMASNYHADAIPTKFVIGPMGDIRFKIVGFWGNTLEEASKVKLMIEMARR